MVARNADRAAALLDDGAPLIGELDGWARVAVAGYLAGGRATLAALRGGAYDVHAARLRPSRARTLGEALLILGRDVTDEPSEHRPASRVQHCERVVRSRARNFAYGIRLLPTTKRQALSAVYAFARRVDDIGDGSQPAASAWRSWPRPARSCAASRSRPRTRCWSRWPTPRSSYPIPLAAFDELIDGCEADVRGTDYATFDELIFVLPLRRRLDRPALARRLRCRPGAPDEAAGYADALGVALQLTNILRDIREDASSAGSTCRPRNWTGSAAR